MNIRCYLSSVLGVFLLSAAQADEVVQGPGITVDDLAYQLGVTGASLVYKRDKPFSKLLVGVVYKERGSDGKYAEAASLVVTTYNLEKPTTEQPITVLLSKDATSVTVGRSRSRGKGIEFAESMSTMNPPARREKDSYEWITVFQDCEAGGETRIKGVVDLLIEARD